MPRAFAMSGVLSVSRTLVDIWIRAGVFCPLLMLSTHPGTPTHGRHHIEDAREHLRTRVGAFQPVGLYQLHDPFKLGIVARSK